MRKLVLFAAAALVASIPVCAQQHFTLKRISYKGDTGYTDQQLQSASGLQPGQSITATDLTNAAQKLMDSGMFKDVDPSLDGPVTGITAILKLTPVSKQDLLPISIDNLVWLDPQVVAAQLPQRVPLYAPRLPQAGNIATQVRDALQAMLEEHGAHVKVDLVDAPSTDTTPETLHWRVNTPAVVLKSVRLNGLTQQTASALRESLKGVVGKPYEEGPASPLDDRLLTPFRNTGYLDATISNLARTPDAEQAGVVGVTITGTVTAGEPYRVGTITYTPAPLYLADRFAATQTLHNGEIASQAALQQTYGPVLDVYHDKGYVDARIDTTPVFDKAAHTVNYTVTLLPGEPYTVAAVHADGLTGSALADYEKNWRLKPGSVYDASYPKMFLRKNSSLLSLHPYTAVYEAKADPATHTIDLTVHFLKNNQD